MSSPTIHGERLLLDRRLDLELVEITETQWREIERIIGVSLSNRTMAIQFYMHLYGMAGSSHSPDNTVLVTDILPALERWMRAGDLLIERLRGKKIDLSSRDAYVALLDEERIQKLRRALPSQLLLFAAESAVGAGQIVRQEIESESRHRPIENDLWSAWVCLTARILKAAGLKISGASIDKSSHANPSPFIRAVIELQSLLPKQCRRYNGYESVRTATQQSLRNMGGLKTQLLVQVLMWGLQLPEHPGYPGNLRKGTKGDIAAFEARVREMQHKIALRNQKFGFDPYSVFPHLRPSSEGET